MRARPLLVNRERRLQKRMANTRGHCLRVACYFQRSQSKPPWLILRTARRRTVFGYLRGSSPPVFVYNDRFGGGDSSDKNPTRSGSRPPKRLNPYKFQMKDSSRNRIPTASTCLPPPKRSLQQKMTHEASRDTEQSNKRYT